MLLEVVVVWVVVWLVVSPVVGVGLGMLIARAGRLADRHELRASAGGVSPAEVPAQPAAVEDLAVEDPAVEDPAAEDVAAEVVPHPSMKLVTDVPGPRPVPSQDDVLHLRLTSPER